MSDDKKDILDDIDLSFDDDFDKEVQESFSEKTNLEQSEDYEDANLNIQDEKTMVQEEVPPPSPSAEPKKESEIGSATEQHASGSATEQQFHKPSPQKTDLEISEHDPSAFEDKSLEVSGGGGSIDSIELGDMIIDSSEDVSARTEDSNVPEEEPNANIQELFADVSEDLSGGATESLKDTALESPTELVDSEEIEIGANTQEKTKEALRHTPKKKEASVGQADAPEPSKTSRRKKTTRRRRGGIDSSTLKKIAAVMLVVFGAGAYMVFFTESGLLGFSMKKPEAKSRLDRAAEEAANLTPELLQELDQKYDRASKFLKVDSYESYQKAMVLYQEILDSFSNHPHSSSALASSTMMGGRGYLDNLQIKDLQKWIRHADVVSPNTSETLRAKIRFLMFQQKHEEAQARVAQMLKIAPEDLDNLMVAAEYHLENKELDQSQEYIDKILSKAPNLIRAHYVKAQLEVAKGAQEKGAETFKSLMDNNNHLPSAVEYFSYLHKKKDPNMLEPLSELVNANSKRMSPKVYATAYKILSEIFEATGEEEKSITMLELAVEKMTLNSAYAYELGIKLEKIKEYEKSTQYLKQANQVSPENHEYTIAYGRNLRYVGKSKEAEALLKPVVTKAPQLEAAIVQYAESRADQGFYEEVITYLQEVVDKEASFVDVQNLLGTLYLEQNRFGDAKRVLLSASKIAKTNLQKATVNRSLGILAIKQEKYDTALGYLKKSNSQQPNHTRTLFALGKIYYHKGQFKESEKHIIDALNIDHLNYEARGILAQIYFDNGKTEEAKKVINEILEDDPKNVSLRVTLGRMLIEEKQYIEAIDHLDEAYLYDSENYETYYYLGIAERESGKVDIAVRSFSRAIEIWGESHNAYYQRGLTFIRKNDIKNASLDMKKANELKPDWTEPNKAIAKYYYEISKYEKASEQYQAIVDVNPKDEESLYFLGKSYFFQEKTDEALNQFAKLLKLSPKDSRAHYEIGVIYEDAGDFPNAYSFLNRAQKLDSKNPEIYYHLGFVLKNLNRRKEAASMFQAYLQLNPNTIEKAEIEDEIYRLLNYP